MKQDFPSTMPRSEQLARLDAGKTPGRKHNKQPGVKAAQRKDNKVKKKRQNRDAVFAGHKGEVAAYWRGERDTLPGKPES